MSQPKALDMAFILEKIKVKSAYGERHKSQMTFYQRGQEDDLEIAFEQLEKMLDFTYRCPSDVIAIQQLLGHLKPLFHTIERLASGNCLSLSELFELKSFHINLDQLREQLIKSHLYSLYELKPVEGIIDLLDPEKTRNTTFHIYSLYSEKLKLIRQHLTSNSNQKKVELIETQKILKAKGLRIKNNGDVLVPKDRLEDVEGVPNLKYAQEMPMLAIYRVAYSTALLEEEQRLKALEQEEENRVRERLSKALAEVLPDIMDNMEVVGRLDLTLSKALFSKAFHCTRPRILEASNRACLRFKKGVHLKVKQLQKNVFTPIDFAVDANVTLITGANMGGKTVALKLVGLLTQMAQMGLFVPCESMEISLFDFIFTAIGDDQSIDEGLSTFGAELVELSGVFKRKNEFGLLLIDEMARGTNPTEGYALSKAMIEYLRGTHLTSVITTHYDGLVSEGVSHYQVNGLKAIDREVLEAELKTKDMTLLKKMMDYRLSKVSRQSEIPKDAIVISELMGLDESIINRAKNILGGSARE